jgi:hypothetical protein
MTDEKIKDLMGRIVSMSPPPPEYPEEMEMARPVDQRRRNPAVIFAVAAAAVLVLAIPLVLWQGADQSPVGGGTTVPPTTQPGQATTVPSVEVTGVIYAIQDPASSFTGNPALVPFEVTVSDDRGLLSSGETGVGLLTRLTELGIELPNGFYTVLPEGIEAAVGSAGAQLITLDMNQKFLEGAGGLLADITMLNQLVYTATQESPGARVLFTVEGEPIEAYGTDGLSLLDAVGRDDFLDEVNPIIITEPVTVVDGQIRVVGRANVYEATVSYRVAGTDVEGFATATCGTGCWGDFEFTLNADEVPTGSFIEVYAESAEDGSPLTMVRIPFTRSTAD